MHNTRSILAWITVYFLVTVSQAQEPSTASDINAEGHKLAKVLDGLDVEHHWLAGKHVKWQTGEPLDRPTNDALPHTHCSAFVAAAAEKLGIYLLRPPKHPANSLANAQYDWLSAEGRKEGWKSVGSALEAQQLANRGSLVVAVFKESDPKKHGHIAIVRPSEKNEAKIKDEGPDIIQAGMDNFSSTSLKEGFKHHKHAFRDNLIRFYEHHVPENPKGT